MRKSISIGVGLLLCLVIGSICAGGASGMNPPGGIQLLDGYQHKPEQGIDTLVGKIWKEGGPEIGYDIGDLGGDSASHIEADKILWKRQQHIGGRDAVIVMTRQNELYITFVHTDHLESANFWAKVTSPEDVADVLLMVMGYQQSGPVISVTTRPWSDIQK